MHSHVLPCSVKGFPDGTKWCMLFRSGRSMCLDTSKLDEVKLSCRQRKSLKPNTLTLTETLKIQRNFRAKRDP